MKNIIWLILIVLMTGAISAQSQRIDYGKIDTGAAEVSIVQLICSPTQYDLKKVKVTGVYLIDSEASYLFLTQEHFKVYDLANSVELGLTRELLPEKPQTLTQLNGYTVVIEGVVHATGGVGGRPAIFPITRLLVKRGGKP